MTADCNGRLIGFVDEQQRWIHCTLHHDESNHPLDTSLCGSVDGQVRRFIHELAPDVSTLFGVHHFPGLIQVPPFFFLFLKCTLCFSLPFSLFSLFFFLYAFSSFFLTLTRKTPKRIR
ncbi:hypothetical protein DM01DRAFT_1010853 [Hesseltinella vesiculosa]|uniref:Uncharacterized protein n=1 Tax=Hesseltinella vesiculosa TaxID=101127 RepID=A0A1X2GYD7_9FUNG|nr:hypothetical protein DM01DRAFT_1010853 [Hesseltinella vesiculosa]